MILVLAKDGRGRQRVLQMPRRGTHWYKRKVK